MMNNEIMASNININDMRERNIDREHDGIRDEMKKSLESLKNIHRQVHGEDAQLYDDLRQIADHRPFILNPRSEHKYRYSIISPNNRYILFENKEILLIYIHRINDGIIEEEPFIKQRKKIDNYIFSHDSKYLMCLGSPSFILIYDMEEPMEQYDQPKYTLELSKIDKNNDMYLSQKLIQVISYYSSYYFHDGLIDKQLNGHVCISNPTGIIIFFQTSDSSYPVRAALVRYRSIKDEESSTRIQEIIFTNHNILYDGSDSKLYVDVFRQNYLLVVKYDKTARDMKINLYKMNINKEDMMYDEILVELSLYSSSSIYTDVDIYIPKNTQYQYVSYDSLHIIDKRNRQLIVLDMNDISREGSIIPFNYMYADYTVYDDGKYIVGWNEKTIELLYKHNDAYVSIYSYDSSDTVSCTLSNDMRYMTIVRKKDVEFVQLDLYDHYTYNLIVNDALTPKFDDDYDVRHVETRGIDVCRNRSFIRYTSSSGHWRDVNVRSICEIDGQLSFECVYMDEEKRIYILHRYTSDTYVRISYIDTITHTVHRCIDREVEGTDLVDRKYSINGQQGYMVQREDKSMIICTFKQKRMIELPPSYNKDVHLIYIHEDILIILKENHPGNYKFMWRYYDSDEYMHTDDVDNMRIEKTCRESGRGISYIYYVQVRFLKDINRIVLLTHDTLMIIDTKSRKIIQTDNTYDNAYSMIISSNNRYICIHEEKKNILYLKSFDNMKDRHRVDDVRSHDGDILEFSDDNRYVIVTKGNGHIESINMIELSVHMIVDIDIPQKYSTDGNLYVYNSKDSIDIVYSDLTYMHNTPYTMCRKIRYIPDNSMILRYIRRIIQETIDTNNNEKNKKLIYDRFNRMMQTMPKHQHRYMSMITILIYTMNDYDTMYEYCKIVGIQTIVSYHRMFSLYYHVSHNNNSMRAIIKSIEDFYKDNNSHIIFDNNEVKDIIIIKKDGLLIDEMCRKMLTLLLFSPYGDTMNVELRDELYSMTIFDYDDNVWTSKRSMNEEIQKSRKNIVREKGEHLSIYSMRRSLIKMDISIGSSFSRHLFSTFSSLHDDDIRSDYKSLIYYKWNQLYMYTLVYSMIYWTMSILSYIYYGDYMDSTILGVCIVVLCSILICQEVKCIISDRRQWVSSLWNWMDMTILVYNSISIIVLLSAIDTYGTIAITWIRVSIVILVGIRSITWLRIFKPTRYLITMVLQVFVDIIPFIVILSSVIVIFAFVWRASPTLGYIDESTIDDIQLTFYHSIYDSTNIIFGNSPQEDPSGDRFTLIRFIVIVIGNVCLALALLNFLIAIISGTYEKINEDKDLHDAKELMNIIIEFDILLSWRSSDKKKHNKEKYLADVRLVEPANQQMQKLWDIEDDLNVNSVKIDRKIDAINTKIDRMNNKIDQRSKQSDDKIMKIMEYLHNMSKNGAGEGGDKAFFPASNEVGKQTTEVISYN